MQIVYCDTCGTRIEEDEDVAAANLPDGTIMCAKCRLAAGKPARQSHARIQLGSSAKRLPTVKASQPGTVTTTAGSRPKRSDSQAKAAPNNKVVLGAIAAVLAIGAAIAWVAGIGQSPETVKRPPIAEPPKAKAAPASTADARPTPADTPVKIDPEKEAEDELDKVLKFEGVADDNVAEKTKRLEAFIKRFPNSIHASRAGSIVRQMRDPLTALAAAPPPLKSAAPLPAISKDGLVGYWDFESLEKGKVSEVSGMTKLQGELIKATVVTDAPRIAGNKQSLHCAFATSRLNFDPNAFHDFGKDITNTFSMCAWVSPANTRAETPEQIDGVTGSNSQRYVIFPTQGTVTHGDGHACAGISVGTNGVSVFEHGHGFLPSPLVYAVALKGWTHIAVVYDKHIPNLYINGKLVRTGKATAKTVHPSISVCSDINYGPYVGNVDEVRVYNRALTEAEIQACATVLK